MHTDNEQVIEEVAATDSGNGNGSARVGSNGGGEFMPEYFSENETLKNLWTDVKRGKIKLTYLSRQTGNNKGTLSQVFNGKYAGDTKKIVGKLELAAAEYYKRGDLVKIRTYVNVRKLCTDAWEGFQINAAYGAAGSGKTEALKSFVNDYEFAIYVKIWDSDNSKEVLDKIMVELDLEPARESLSRRIQRISDKLKREPRLMIVDEADNSSIKVLNCLRQIWDDCNCGIILSGNMKLKWLMTRGDSGSQNLSYLYRRITKVLPLEGLQYGDAKLLLERYDQIDISDSCIRELIKMVKNNGETDRFCKIMDAAIEQAEYNKVTTVNDAVVMQAAKTMLWG
ncbi:MAG TPA: AAA family ATPase [bacterium]|nr:AAA family ATPase [bacterium]HPN44179.1 AAA family ATPase [bacterium]